MGRLYPDFQAENCEILAILGDPVDKAKQYAEILHLPFPVLSDPDRAVYHQFGLEKAFIFIQRTASLVIDPQGIIQYVKATANPMTWLDESRELLAFVKSMPENPV